MSEHWTKRYNPKYMDAGTRESFVLQDYLQKLEARIQKLEEKSK